MSAAETVEEPTVVAAANPEPVQDVVMEKPEKEPEPKTEDDSNLPLKDINEMEKFIDEAEESSNKISVDIENHSG